MADSVNSDSFAANSQIYAINPAQVKALPLATNIGQGNLLTGPKISTAYSIPASTGAGVKVGIISLGGGFNQSDINQSMSDLGLVTGNVTFIGVNGATNNYTGTLDDAENTLDIVCVAGMAPAANIVLYKGQNLAIQYLTNPQYASSVNQNSSFGNTIQRAVDDDCDIISISWGSSEKGFQNGTTFFCGDYMAKAFANAAAKGITVFVASGDYGSQAVDSNNPIFKIVSTDYPAVNANVTAVGGTYLQVGAGNTWQSETVYNNSQNIPGFGGGGGISSMIPKPSYQQNLTYQTFPNNNVRNLDSRGIPDISAAMNAYGIWLGNTVYGVSGTSASAPIMAGILARYISLNGGRRPPVGAFNSIIYADPGSFRDISTGNNASLLPIGYAATPGWDAVVGYGPIANGVQTYQTITSAGVRIKNESGDWAPVKNVQIKTGENSWSNAKIWIKTNASTWKQVY